MKTIVIDREDAGTICIRWDGGSCTVLFQKTAVDENRLLINASDFEQSQTLLNTVTMSTRIIVNSFASSFQVQSVFELVIFLLFLTLLLSTLYYRSSMVIIEDMLILVNENHPIEVALRNGSRCDCLEIIDQMCLSNETRGVPVVAARATARTATITNNERKTIIHWIRVWHTGIRMWTSRFKWGHGGANLLLAHCFHTARYNHDVPASSSSSSPAVTAVTSTAAAPAFPEDAGRADNDIQRSKSTWTIYPVG